MAELNCISALKNSANLKAYYRFIDDATITTDFSGNGYTLTNTGTTATIAGQFNNAADFGSSNSTKMLNVNDAMGIDGGAISIVCWVKVLGFPTAGNTVNPVHQVNDTSKTEYMIKFFRTKTGVSQDGVGYFNYDPGTTDWHHYALTYDGTNIRGYIDGTLQLSPVAVSGNGSSTLADKVTIGADYYGTKFSGVVDDVAIFNTALSAGNITSLYSGSCDVRTSDFLSII
jgi:hypothetical protein